MANRQERVGPAGLFSSTFRQYMGMAIFNHLVPCFFVGTFSFYYLSPLILGELSLTEVFQNEKVGLALLINGGVVAAGTWLFHLYLDAREHRGRHLFHRKGSGELYRNCGALVGFLCGSFDVLLLLNHWGVFVIAGVTVIMLVLHIRSFFRKAVELLNPARSATWRDIGDLVHIYAVTIAAFTLTLVSLGISHEFMAGGRAFQSPAEAMELLDALYFTIVVMTTLGFGDIYPLTPGGKIVTVVLCMVSYVMLAMMLGIITGGITPDGEKKEK